MFGAIIGLIIVGLICATVAIVIYRPDIVASITGTKCPTKLTCLNGGAQNPDTCLCVCPNGYGGLLCENKITPPNGGNGGSTGGNGGSTGGGDPIKTCSGNCVNGAWDKDCVCICDQNWQGSDCNTAKTIINPNLVSKIIISNSNIKIGTITFQADGLNVIPQIATESYRITYSFINPVNITKIIHIAQSGDTSHLGNQIDLFNGNGSRFGDTFTMTSDKEIYLSYKYGLIIDKQFVKQPLPIGGGGDPVKPPVCQHVKMVDC